jgi:hypothetical protein
MLSNVRGLGAPRAATRARHTWFRYVPGSGMKTLETPRTLGSMTALPMRERVAKMQGSAAEEYVYDPEGHLVSAHNAATTTLWNELYSPDGRHVATRGSNRNWRFSRSRRTVKVTQGSTHDNTQINPSFTGFSASSFLTRASLLAFPEGTNWNGRPARGAIRCKKRSMAALLQTFAQEHHEGNRQGASSVLVAAPPRCATLLMRQPAGHSQTIFLLDNGR